MNGILPKNSKLKTKNISRSRWATRCLVGICVLAAALMLWAAWTDSATNDEVVHIPAGYDYITQFTYHLNPEHPPLIKALSATPLLFLRPTFPAQTYATSSPTLNEVLTGVQFLYKRGNNADAIVQVARIVPIAITILAIIFVYLLSQMLMEPWWSLVPAFLFALDPTILAHGHYVTTDVGATLGIVAATYYFFQHLKTRSRNSLWIAGIALGVAELTKFSAIVLIPFFFLVYPFRRKIQDKAGGGAAAGTETAKAAPFRDLIFIFLIGYGIVYLAYALFMVNYPMAQQISDTVLILQQWLGGVHGLGTFDVWMAGNVLLRPAAQYLLGLLMVAGHVGNGALVYAFGTVAIGSSWCYFPAIFALKEPIPTLIIIATALLFGFKNILTPRANAKNGNSSGHALVIFSFFLFVVVYWCVSITSPLDHGIRYLIPTFPFIYILAAYAWSILLAAPATSSDSRRGFAQIAGYVALGGLLLWVLVEGLITAPYFLSYYNEFAGGTMNGYRYATDSNYDWGQDFLRFQSFMDQHPEISRIAVGYLGSGDLHYYLGNRAVDWSSAQGNPAGSGIHWFAISIDTLELSTQQTASGLTVNASDTYQWLMALREASSSAKATKDTVGNVPEPDYRVGTSIFVYKL